MKPPACATRPETMDVSGLAVQERGTQRPGRRSALAAVFFALLATHSVLPASEWVTHEVPAGGFSIELPGKPVLETFRIEEVEGTGGSGSVAFSQGKDTYVVSFAAIKNPAHPKADETARALGEKLLDFWSGKLSGSWVKSADLNRGGTTGIELDGKAKDPARTAKARVLRAAGRRYILIALAAPADVARFLDSLKLSAVVPPAPDPGNGKSPAAADWRKVTLKEAACEADLPGPANFKNIHRLEQSDGSGWMGAEGFHKAGTGKSGGGTFVILYGRTTGTKASPQELRRLTATTGEKAAGILRKEFLKAADEKWTTAAGNSATDTSYFTRSATLEARLRKIVYADRVYFLIGIGAPQDVARFFESVKPLAADSLKPL